MILLDTDIMIDINREYEPTLNWFATLAEPPALPGFVVLELINGCRDRKEMKKVERLVESFQVCWPTERDCNRAIKTFSQCYLAHGTGPTDILIGQTAVGLKATLYTFNLKHFNRIP